MLLCYYVPAKAITVKSTVIPSKRKAKTVVSSCDDENVKRVITMSGTGVFGNTTENYSSGSRLHKAIFSEQYIDIENIITELPL